ncbi:hypothetical protein KDA_71910 [Dictyobacter alpinus]|uniref:GtrA/DPMS transmembrane domain-containing protein n=1 Tax=Dictyobacter alpinus TaxID=2014873 RepID=A0A402BK22_9CHLR|nr:GtrA family protein [Dictyobacter alpinus]GCE31707.1 hypothetical protein KDA_71910 [Dictyobacter alpinus]
MTVTNRRYAPARFALLSALVRTKAFWQIVRFSLVGITNSAIDILVLNLLLWLAPPPTLSVLLTYNISAYILGALNSFFWNKYWTFRQKKHVVIYGELIRFSVVTLISVCVNSGIVWSSIVVLQPFIKNQFLLTNSAKIAAVIGTSIVSYIGMRLWVFEHSARKLQEAELTVEPLIPETLPQ